MKKIISLSLACLMLVCTLFVLTSCDTLLALTPFGEKENDTALSFTFEVVHLDGTEKVFEVTSNKKYLGDALVEKGYISGHESQYGLTVETVDGETLDWDTSSAYWALYINGEYAQTGVDTTVVEEGAVYSFVAETYSW